MKPLISSDSLSNHQSTNNNNKEPDKPTIDPWIQNWGFKLDQLFKIATKFFKDNEGKVFHPSYNERNQFLALVLQFKHGPFDQAKASPLGALDIVGRDRRQAWADLKDITKDNAMSTFIQLLDSSCPPFRPYIEAHKREKEEREKQKIKEEEEKSKKEDEEKMRKKEEEEEEESKRKRSGEYFLPEEQRCAIKDALNKQTYLQFKSYAEQQYPNDLDQQNILITKLQEQHYEQYMQQIVQTRLISDMMIGRSSVTSSPSSIPSSPLTQTTSESPASPSPSSRKEDCVTSSNQTKTNYSYGSPSGSSSSTSGVSSASSSSGFHPSPTLPSTNSISYPANVIRTNSLSQSTFQEIPVDDGSSNDKLGQSSVSGSYHLHHQQHDVTTSNQPYPYPQTHHHQQSSAAEKSLNDCDGGVVRLVGGGAAEEDGDDESCPEELEPLEPPNMWTTKDIVGFKASIGAGNDEGVLKIGHGEIINIRVPTHPDGGRLFWEFATDSYDIGFGLFFEWTKNPGDKVSVQVSESEDESDEEEEDELIDSTGARKNPSDPEKGANTKCINSDDPPSTMIVPIYRRDCHEEVYVGSHYYHGKGAYILKFDNSYSLWRSKTLYYRVYYTK